MPASKDGVTKFCPTCEQTKSIEDFHNLRTRVDGKYGRCKECALNASRKSNKRRKLFPDRVAKRKQGTVRSRLRCQWGMSIEEYNAMLANQNGACAICGNPSNQNTHNGYPARLAVDHSHETGVIRGLLCRTCNLGIGNFLDLPVLLEAAVAYLRAHGKT